MPPIAAVGSRLSAAPARAPAAPRLAAPLSEREIEIAGWAWATGLVRSAGG